MPELEADQRPSRPLWVFAALGALALHLGGGALAIANLQSGDDGDALGVTAIEVGLDLKSPHDEATDLPPGPNTDASVASPALAEQKAEVKETELPKDRPDETEDPDRVVTTNDSKKPKEDDPKIAAVQTSASTESVAQEATAKQSLDSSLPDAENVTGPNVGIGKDKERLTAEWGRRISAYFELHKRYPKVQKLRAAKVKVSLVLNRMGQVVSVAVLQSSGDPSFDEAAISMIRRSDPVPRPPAKLTDERFSYSLDVNFNERK